MTREELDERISMLKVIARSEAVRDDGFNLMTVQLIRDVIAAVRPRTPDYYPAHEKERQVYKGYVTAIDTIEQNTKELLG